MSMQQLNKKAPNKENPAPGNSCSKCFVLVLYFQPLFSFLHQIPTILDYKEVLSSIVSLERRTLHLYSFICELSLLNTSLSVYSPARLAAAALLLAKMLHEQGKQSYLKWSCSMVCQSAFSFQGDFLGCQFVFRQDVSNHLAGGGGEKGGEEEDRYKNSE